MLSNKGSSCGKGSVFPKESSKNNSLRVEGNISGEGGKQGQEQQEEMPTRGSFRVRVWAFKHGSVPVAM